MLGISRRWASWQTAKNLSIGVAAFLLFFFLYIWRLGTLVPGLSAHEVLARQASGTVANIINDPINAPHKVIQCFFQVLDYHGAFWMRSVSVLYALVFIISLYLLLRVWFGKFIATIGTLLFVTTPWIILAGRNAAPDVMWLSPLLLMASYAEFCRTEKKINIAWALFLTSIVICIYTPGIIWFLLFVFVLKAKKISSAILKVKRSYIIGGFTITFLLLLPLAYAIAKNASLAKDLLLVPHHLIDSSLMIHKFLWTWSSLVYRLPLHVDYAVGRLPVLDLVQSVLALVGIYAMWQKAKRETLIVLSLVLVPAIAVTFSGSLLLLLIALPGLVVLDAAGLRYLYKRWFYVFPINPLARAFAICLVSLIVLAHVAYGVRYALLAWPHNVEARKAYMLK